MRIGQTLKRGIITLLVFYRYGIDDGCRGGVCWLHDYLAQKMTVLAIDEERHVFDCKVA